MKDTYFFAQTKDLKVIQKVVVLLNSTVLRAYMKKKTKELVSDKKIRINASGCLDHCEFGPTLVVYPDNVWYSCKTEKEVDQVINEHLINDRIAENLQIKK